jgi:hypothetical protein
LWCVKNDKSTGYTFNHNFLKKYNGGKQLRSNWFIRTRGKVIPEVFETSVCSPNERIRKDNGKKLHSVQKPVVLLERIILGCTKKGDIVLDPFSGTGTTGYVCQKHGRNFICFEKEQEYIKPSNHRLSTLKLTRKEVNSRFIKDPDQFIHLQYIGKNYEKPYSTHKKHIDRLIERYLLLKQSHGRSMDITQVILSTKDWEKSLWKSNPENIRIINDLVKKNSVYKDKFGKKRSLVEFILKDFQQINQFMKITPTKFRKLVREYGFRVNRSNDQYFIYPK